MSAPTTPVAPPPDPVDQHPPGALIIARRLAQVLARLKVGGSAAPPSLFLIPLSEPACAVARPPSPLVTPYYNHVGMAPSVCVCVPALLCIAHSPP